MQPNVSVATLVASLVAVGLAGCGQSSEAPCAGGRQAYATEGELPWVDARSWTDHLVGEGPLELDCHTLHVGKGASYVLAGATGRVESILVDGTLTIRDSEVEARVDATADASMTVESSTIHGRTATFGRAQLTVRSSHITGFDGTCGSGPAATLEDAKLALGNAGSVTVTGAPDFTLDGIWGCVGVVDDADLGSSTFDVHYLHVGSHGGSLVLPAGAVDEFTFGVTAPGHLDVRRGPSSIPWPDAWEALGWMKVDAGRLAVTLDGADGTGCSPCGGELGTVVFTDPGTQPTCVPAEGVTTGTGRWLDLSATDMADGDLHIRLVASTGATAHEVGEGRLEQAPAILTVPNLQYLCSAEGLVEVGSLAVRLERSGSADEVACADVAPDAAEATLRWVPAVPDADAGCEASRRLAAWS